MFKEFLQANFSNINDDMLITSYVNLNREKEDIWIKVGKEKKSISIKMGNANTVHNEYIYSFTNYLAKEKVPLKIINIICEKLSNTFTTVSQESPNFFPNKTNTVFQIVEPKTV